MYPSRSWSSNQRKFDWFSALFKTFVFIFICAVLFGILSVFCGRLLGIRWHYGDGDRIGTVYKLSKKGMLFKTHEGELNVGGVASDSSGIVVPNVWAFSIRPQEAAEIVPKIERAMSSGHRVRLSYSEYAVSPISWGSTQYYITAVTDETPTPLLEKKK